MQSKSGDQAQQGQLDIRLNAAQMVEVQRMAGGAIQRMMIRPWIRLVSKSFNAWLENAAPMAEAWAEMQRMAGGTMRMMIRLVSKSFNAWLENAMENAAPMA